MLLATGALTRPTDAEAEADTRGVEEALRLRDVWPRQVLNIGEDEVPLLMQIGLLRLLPELVSVALDVDLDIDAHRLSSLPHSASSRPCQIVGPGKRCDKYWSGRPGSGTLELIWRSVTAR